MLYAPRALPPLPPDVSQDPGPYAAWVRGPRGAAGTGRAARPGDRICAWSWPWPTTTRRPSAARSRASAASAAAGGRSPWSRAEDRLAELRALVRSSTWRSGNRRRVRVLRGRRPGRDCDLLEIGIEASPGVAAGPDLPGRRLGARHGRPAERGAHAGERGLCRRGRGAGRRHRRGASVEARLLARVPPRRAPTSAVPSPWGPTVADHLPRLVASDTAALEHECALAATEIADDRDPHPEVLCHRSAGRATASAPPPSTTSQRRSAAAMTTSVVVGRPAPRRIALCGPAKTDVPVSILIPFRDEPRLLRTCVDSIAATTGMHTTSSSCSSTTGPPTPRPSPWWTGWPTARTYGC